MLDINIGKDTSLELAETLRGRGIPLIFASGYGDAVQSQASGKSEPVLRKPYTREQLGTAIRASLDLSRRQGFLAAD